MAVDLQAQWVWRKAQSESALEPRPLERAWGTPIRGPPVRARPLNDSDLVAKVPVGGVSHRPSMRRLLTSTAGRADDAMIRGFDPDHAWRWALGRVEVVAVMGCSPRTRYRAPADG
jgi:hypothetical protein